MENIQNTNNKNHAGRELTLIERAWRAKMLTDAIKERNQVLAFVWSGQHDDTTDD
jgi:hypothetical protein